MKVAIVAIRTSVLFSIFSSEEKPTIIAEGCASSRETTISA
jgi:hypothetical protein